MIPDRRAAALFCLWIVAISYRYGNTVLRGFRSPFRPGSDIEWLAGWLLTAIVMIVLAAAVKRAVAIVYSILAAACVLILILSGTFLAAIAAGAILLVGHLAGRALLLFLGVKPDDVALTIPLGLIVPALLGFVLAALHLLTPLAIGLLLAGLAVAAVYDRRVFRTGDVVGPNRPPLQLPFLLIAPVIFLNLTWAVVPEIQFDANNYHLAVSQIYLRNCGFIDLPYFFHSYFHHFIDMLFTLAIALSGAAAAKLLSFGFSLIAAAAVFSLGKLVFDELTGAWAAAFFYTTPVVSWLSATAYTDNAVALFLTATVIAFLQWHRSREQTGWLYAASLLAGATLAAKVNAAFGLPVMIAVAFWRLRTHPKTLAVCALLIVMVALPWYGLIYHWTGNPVFPILNGFFKSPLWDFENRVMDANAYGIGFSPAALSRLPFWLTWNTIRFGTATPRGAAGIMLLFAFPFGFAWLARKQNATILLATAIEFFLLWAFGFQNVRYYVHILPVVCVLGAATVFHFSQFRWAGIIARICLVTQLVLQFPATSMEFWNIPERFPITTALGLEARQEFLRRSLDSYAGAERLNAVIKPGERVVGMDVEDARFYLDAPLETLSDSTVNSVLRTAASTSSGEMLLRTLRQSGFEYIFARRESLKELPAWFPYLQPQFLDQFATLIFRDGNTVVYRLNS